MSCPQRLFRTGPCEYSRDDHSKASGGLAAHPVVKWKINMGTAAQSYNPSTQEDEAGGLLVWL